MAVLPFDNLSGRAELDPLCRGFQEMLITDLAQSGGIRVVERARLADLLAELQLAEGRFVDPATAAKIGKGVGATAVLVGSFGLDGPELRIDARFVAPDTTEVLLAKQVTGTRDQVFALQARLAESLLQGLNVPLRPEALLALRGRQADFDAFCLYSEALVAKDAGHTDEATERLKKVLAQHADFDLARRSLDALEAEAILMVSELEQQRRRSVAEVGRTLEAHSAKQQEAIRARRFDPPYFAALVSASAHAGLAGNSKREAALLVRYWNDYAEHVPPEQALGFFEKVNRIVAEDGKFFQEQVDSGTWYLPRGLPGHEDRELKPALRGKLSWPEYAVIWPFGKDVRFAFNIAQGARDTMPAVGQAEFERQLPRYPTDYLGQLLECQDQDPRLRNELYCSIIRYHAQVPRLPDELSERLRIRVVSRLLRNLETRGPETWDARFLSQAIAAHRLLGQTAEDPEHRERAGRLLVRYVQHAKLLAADLPETDAESPTPDAGPVRFFDLRLSGSPLVFVWITDLGSGLTFMGMEKAIANDLSDLIRTLPADRSFNMVWVSAERRGGMATLFPEPKVADSRSKLEAIEGLQSKQPRPNTLGESSLEDRLEEVARTAGGGELILIWLVERPRLSEGAIAQLAEMPDRPRFHAVVAVRPEGDIRDGYREVGQLVALTGGSAVQLRNTATLGFAPKIQVTPWDVSDLKPNRSPSR